MINNIVKDRVLTALCNLQCFESMMFIDLKELLSETETTFDELQAILMQFQRLGLISDLNMRRHSPQIYFVLYLEALEFSDKGGFQMQDEMLKLTLEKLKLEVEQLSKDFPEKALTFSSILSNISTVLGFFISK
nr:MAG TPA: hypothetical protein [Caudoviricetes sp.]